MDDLNVCEDEQYLPESEDVDSEGGAVGESQRLISGYIALFARNRSLRVNGKLPTERHLCSELMISTF